MVLAETDLPVSAESKIETGHDKEGYSQEKEPVHGSEYPRGETGSSRSKSIGREKTP